MIKKFLQVVTAFGLLLAGYAVYVRGFAVAVERLGANRSVTSPPVVHERSRSERRATEVAVRGFGPGHWATDPVLGYRYYNADRRYWIYTRDYKRLNDGKQLEFSPFAIIWESRDGKSLLTATSDSARIDLDQPLGLVSKSGEGSGSMRVVRARVEGNVQIRDDKGTPETADDLRISFPGPVPSIEYDEAALEVRSDSSVVIEDRDLRITGEGLLITLRPREPAAAAGGKAPSGGFDGAQTAVLRKNVHITIADVGADGILPGNARPDQRRGARTPLEVRCAGMMQIDLPRPNVPVRVGPPAPPGPTIAQFFRNVEVLRGRPEERPDQLDCDHLRLTLVNAVKAAPPEATAAADSQPRPAAGVDGAPAASPPGPLRELTLQRAVASGHNVRITSASQGIRARCNELFHEKKLPEAPDTTYLRGDATSPLIVEKTDVAGSGPNRGRVMSFTTIRTIDATVFGGGEVNGVSTVTIVARGPGELESRPAPDRPVERSARWSDQLSLTDDPATAAQLGLPELKKVTLTGRPNFVDHPAEAELSARDVLVVWLKPKTPTPAPAPASGGAPARPAAPSQSFEIRQLVALKDVRLSAPHKVLVARDRLDAEFKADDGALTVMGTGTADTRTTAPSAPAAPTAPPPPPEADAEASAGKVWASVKLRPGGSGGPGGGLSATGAELTEVRLRGSVVFRQAPAAGKERGVDVSGEAVDVSNQGRGVMRFAVYHHDPTAVAGPVVAPVSDGRKAVDPAEVAPLARIETEELTVTGKVIGLDQSTDEAWVDGRGSLTQMAARGLLSDRGLTNAPEGTEAAKGAAAVTVRPPDANGAPVPKVPMTISWADGMKFFGRSTDPQGRKVARAEFYKDVRAETDEAVLTCSTVMRTYLDRTVALTRPPAGTAPPAGPPAAGTGAPGTPKADIALIECIGNVVVVNEKRDPTGESVVEKQRIEGVYLLFDKATGRFDIPGTGQVVLYQREGQVNPFAPAGNRSDNRSEREGGSDPLILRVSDGPPVVGRVPNPVDRAAGQRGAPAATRPGAPAAGRQAAPGRSAAPAGPPLVVTQVRFRKGMTGRFGTGKLTDRAETRRADFFGDIEVVHGNVPDADALLDPDRLPRGAQFMTAQILRVVSEPKVGKPGQPDPPPVYFLRAWENAVLTADDKTITADTITFDSEKMLFWAYGEGGRPVVVAQQDQVGLGFSNATGRAAVYNHNTGEARFIEPNGLQILDSRTGARPTPVAPPSQTVKPQLPKRTPLRNPAGNINDRKSFRGGQ